MSGCQAVTKLPNRDLFAVRPSLPEIVLHLLLQPAFRAAAEGLRQPDCHFGRNPETPVEQQGKRVARHREPLRGLGDGQDRGARDIAA